jgi:hypothetical protein
MLRDSGGLIFVHVQIFDILSSKQEIGMDSVCRSHKCRFFIGLLATFSSVRTNVLQSYRGILFVDAVQQTFVTDILFRNQ